MSCIEIIGKTSQQLLDIVSLERSFVLDEYLMVTDDIYINIVGEVIESYAYPNIDSNISSDISFKNLSKKFPNLEQAEVVYVGKLKILTEIHMPIDINAKVTLPNFDDIEKLLINTTKDRGFTLGVIKGTEDIQKSIHEDYCNIAPLYDSKKGIIKQMGIPFLLDYYSFREYPHIGIFGSSGSGKSYCNRIICEEIMQKGIPGVLFDPHYELDFTEIAKDYPEELKVNFKNKHEIFHIGEDVGIDFSDITTEDLCSLLEFVSDLTQPMRAAIEALHEKKDSMTSLKNKIEKLKNAFENQERQPRDREELPEDVVKLYYRYQNKVAGIPTLQAISWRLDQLEKTGIFSSNIIGVETALLNRKLAVIRGKSKLLKMIASYLLKKLYMRRRLYKDWEQSGMDYTDSNIPKKFPPFIIIIDEAHNFAPNGTTNNPTKQILREISQEARKYGVYEVFGTQRPSLLDPTISAQLNTKIIFRTTMESDISSIKLESNLNYKQVARLPELTSGNAFVTSATLRKTMYVRFRATKTITKNEKHPFDELSEFDSNVKLKTVLKRYLPFSISSLPKYHSEINNAIGQTLTIHQIEEALEDMAEKNEVKKERTPFGVRYL